MSGREVVDWNLGTQNLRIEREGPIAWCVIDRPKARNALTPAMYFGIKRAVRLVNTDPELRALIITGTGDSFAPGGDLGGRYEPGDERVPEGLTHETLPFMAIRDSVAPVVAAVNGICQAGGLLIAMLSDIAVVSETPKPAVIEVAAEAAAAAAEPAAGNAEIAQADAAEDVAVATIEATEPKAETPVVDAASRAEQLRGLFDNARQDAANAPVAPQDDAASEATRNA